MEMATPTNQHVILSLRSRVPLGLGPPEPLTLLHRRLLQAEEEAQALVRDAGALGDHEGSAPASPLKEHRASRREAVELRARLQRACMERDAACREVWRLGERLEEAAVAKREVALAADELKIVTKEMSQKLTKMRRQLEDEAERRRALRTRLVEQLQNQDFLLAAVRRNVHIELQVALRDKVNLQSELEKLTDKHSRLLQSSSAAQETANTQRKQLERTIERLRGEPRPQEGPTRKDQQGSRTQVSELEADGQTQQRHLNSQSRQQRPDDSIRLQAGKEIGKHRVEVEKLQRLLTATHSKSSRALKSLLKTSDEAIVDNKRLAQSLERHRAAATLRDEELRQARTEIVRLSQELRAAKQRRREDASEKTLRREISELKGTVKDSEAGSGDSSKANRELRQRACEQLACEQTPRITEQRRRQESRDSQDYDNVQASRRQETELQRWTLTMQRWEAMQALALSAAGSGPARTLMNS